MGATAAFSVQAISSLAGSYSESQALRAQGDYTSTINAINADFAEFQAKDATERGEFAAAEVTRKYDRDMSNLRFATKKVMGKQRANLAGQGIDITSGSAADIIAESRFLSARDESEVRRAAAMDALTTKNNAWREAWGFKVQAADYASKGRMARLAGEGSARATLLAGGAKALSYGFKAYGSGMKEGLWGSKADLDEGDVKDGFYMPSGKRRK
jgi:hypothetical protein